VHCYIDLRYSDAVNRFRMGLLLSYSNIRIVEYLKLNTSLMYKELVPAVKFAKMHKLVFSMSFLQNLIAHGHTDKQTDRQTGRQNRVHNQPAGG